MQLYVNRGTNIDWYTHLRVLPDNNESKPICIRLPQMIGYAKYFNDNKFMSFKVIDKNLLNKNNKIWEKVEVLLNVKMINT